MNRFLTISAAVFCILPTTIIAKDFSELHVGDVACIDVLGPWNKVGTIVEMRSSSQEILLRDGDGQEKWYPASKTRNVMGCKVTGEAAKWLVEKGIDNVTSSN